jgi:PAS domain S-box-containing protein
MESELAATLLEQAPDAVIFAGTDGVITVWNAAAEQVFGHKAADAIGKDLNIIIPQQYQDAHWTGYDRALADGETKFKGQALTTRAVRADGETIYVDLAFAIIKDARGTVTGAMATARDVTERFNRDREMRRELRELKAGKA